MGLLLLIGVITLCATAESGIKNFFRNHLSIATEVKCIRCACDEVRFWLRSSETGEKGFVITESNMDTVTLLPGPLKVFIHGYTARQEYKPNPHIVPAYLNKVNYNILSVYWGKVGPIDSYFKALRHYPVVAYCTARLLTQLYETRGQHWKELTHIIGFSIGAHIAGVIGYYLRGLPRITGLDPAMLGPIKVESRFEYKLDYSDAIFVDVYHTNCGLVGSAAKIGHADFYVNKCRFQPGCYTSRCDHLRSIALFAESVNNPEAFYARPCKRSWIFLKGEICPYNKHNNTVFVRAGENVSNGAVGSFKLETGAHEPFGRGLPENMTNMIII